MNCPMKPFTAWLLLLAAHLGDSRKLASTGQGQLEVFAGFGNGRMDMSTIESLVLAVSKEGATPALEPYLLEIEEMVNTSINAIELRSEAVQRGLDAVSNVYDICLHQQADSVNLTDLGAIHVACRKDEAAAKEAMEHACEFADSETQNMWAACDHFHHDINPVSDKVPEICDGEFNETNEQHAKRLQDWFTKKVAEWKNANNSCSYRTNRSRVANDTCDEKTNEYSNKVKECDVKQNHLDVGACDYFQHHNCSEHEQCWNRSTVAYMRANTSAAIAMESNMVEWRGLMRVRCLVRAIGESDADREAAIERCKNARYDDSFLILNFTYYASPLTPELPVMPDCVTWDHEVENYQPGTIEYMEHWYSDLPDEAPATACTSDCCTTCYFYPHCGERPKKLRSRNIEAFTQDECCQVVAWHASDWDEKCQTGCGHDAHVAHRNVSCQGDQGTPVDNVTLCGLPVPAESESCEATEDCPECDQPCRAGFYRVGCEDRNATDSKCVHCTEEKSKYFTGDGGYSDSCPTAVCSPSNCGIGEYLSDCEGSGDGGSCVACSPIDGFYFKTRGHFVDGSCTPSPCPDCPAGEYRVGCSGASEGTCEVCSGAAPGYYYSGSGESADTCETSKCAQDCPLAYHRNGCGNGSAGSCESCNLEDDTYAVRYGRLYDRCQSVSCDHSKCFAGYYLEGCGGNSSGTCEKCAPPKEGFWYPSALPDANCEETACTNCSSGYYRTECGGANASTSGGICQKCSGITEHHYFVGHGGLADECEIGKCEDLPKCAAGLYREGCGDLSKGSCVACETPREGIYYSGPGNLTNNSCPSSPCDGSNCPVGTFLKKCGGAGNPSAAGTCVQCSVPDEGFYFISNGGLKNDCGVASCSDLPECPAGQYRAGCGGAENPLGQGECKPCTNEEHGWYFIGHGGITGRCKRANCFHDVAACEAGQYRHGCGVSPNTTSIGECDTCNVPPENYYIAVPGGEDNADCAFEKCSELSPCSVGEYRANCGGKDHPNSEGVCATCPAPVAGSYYAEPGALDSDCPQASCLDLLCNEGEYRSGCGGANGTDIGSCVACSAPPDNFYYIKHGGLNDSCPTAACADLPKCTTGQYRSECGGASNPIFKGRCADCSAPPEGYFIIGDGGLADKCTIEECSALRDCPTGEYRKGCGVPEDTTGTGTCVACSDPPADTYITSHGGQADACGQANCDTLPSCDIGEYRTGCGGPANRTGTGYCTSCTLPEEGYFLRTSGGLVDACAKEKCVDQPDCAVGEYRKDCGGAENPTSAGVCRPCVLGISGVGLPAGNKWITSGGLEDACRYEPAF
eukprot:gb/GFBE01031638.1/.p1 GENE.gb/GFBE01031638.1/~~gb/GFBE01031638.1/.p1  ORF type:complete len:1312 (+),score=237.37 gb/GFBE01031638.1/:1-3936(+)